MRMLPLPESDSGDPAAVSESDSDVSSSRKSETRNPFLGTEEHRQQEAGPGKARKRPLPGSDSNLPKAAKDVPRHLEQRYGIAAVPNPEMPGELQVDPSVLGLKEAQKAAIEFLFDRGARGIFEDAMASETEAGREARTKAFWRTRAPALAGAPLTPSESKEMLVRFVETFQRINLWILAEVEPLPSANLPLEVVLQIAWWLGYQPRRPTPNRVRSFVRLMARHRQGHFRRE